MIAIIKYNAGNVRSVQNTLKMMNQDSVVTDDAETIKAADKVIFPGVGEANSAMKYLQEKGLDTLIKSLSQPTLGICLGLQIMCTHSEEGDTDCLGIFDSKVKKFEPKLKVPHMGWNNLNANDFILLSNIKNDSDYYFVHSYYATVSEETKAICDYIVPFSACMQKNNFYATQFHPEKSAEIGVKVLQNFLNL